MSEMRAYSIGYSGKSIGSFVETLQAAGVTALVDVRHLPASRFRPEFSKRNLRDRIESSGIQYLHKRELGIPSAVRRAHGYPNHSNDLWDWYEAEVLETHLGDLDWIPQETDTIAVMCVESDPEKCHRTVLARALITHGVRYEGDL